MRRDCRLSVALHVLLHMQQLGRVVTSEELGPLLNMNPVLVRRTIGGLRDAGIVRSEKGHGGGWALARPLEAVTLADVYAALNMPALFSIGHRDEKPRCPLEQSVNHALGSALDEAEALILSRLRSVSVGELVTKAAAQRAGKGKHAHA